MAGGDGGPCGCEVLGCGFDVGDAPGDDGVGEQGDSFALDVLEDARIAPCLGEQWLRGLTNPRR